MVNERTRVYFVEHRLSSRKFISFPDSDRKKSFINELKFLPRKPLKMNEYNQAMINHANIDSKILQACQASMHSIVKRLSND